MKEARKNVTVEGERDLKNHRRMRGKIQRIEGVGSKMVGISIKEGSNEPEGGRIVVV